MAHVTITAAARTLICEQLSRYRPYHAALVGGRQTASGELIRGPCGEALWYIDRPDGWEASVAEIRNQADSRRKNPLPVPITSVGGIPVVLQRSFHGSLHVHVRNGKLRVHASQA